MSNGFGPRRRMRFGSFGGRLSTLLIGIGLLVIALGWNGAAGTTALAAQFPYLLSGGLIGLSFVLVGCSLMTIHGYREERMRLEEKLDLLVDAVTRAGGVGRSAGGSASLATPSDVAGLVVAGSASYHVPGCRLVDGREEVDYLTPEEARARFLQACRVCQPEPSNVSVR